MMLTLVFDALCFITVVMLLPCAWRNPQLRTAGPYGRRAERMMYISIVALVAALLIRP